jgi:hypothetical protein
MAVGVGVTVVVGVGVGPVPVGTLVRGPQAKATANSMKKRVYFRADLGIGYDSFGGLP